jgi:hypothetical protein
MFFTKSREMQLNSFSVGSHSNRHLKTAKTQSAQRIPCKVSRNSEQWQTERKELPGRYLSIRNERRETRQTRVIVSEKVSFKRQNHFNSLKSKWKRRPRREKESFFSLDETVTKQSTNKPKTILNPRSFDKAFDMLNIQMIPCESSREPLPQKSSHFCVLSRSELIKIVSWGL